MSTDDKSNEASEEPTDAEKVKALIERLKKELSIDELAAIFSHLPKDAVSGGANPLYIYVLEPLAS